MYTSPKQFCVSLMIIALLVHSNVQSMDTENEYQYPNTQIDTKIQMQGSQSAPTNNQLTREPKITANCDTLGMDIPVMTAYLFGAAVCGYATYYIKKTNTAFGIPLPDKGNAGGFCALAALSGAFSGVARFLCKTGNKTHNENCAYTSNVFVFPATSFMLIGTGFFFAPPSTAAFLGASTATFAIGAGYYGYKACTRSGSAQPNTQ